MLDKYKGRWKRDTDNRIYISLVHAYFYFILFYENNFQVANIYAQRERARYYFNFVYIDADENAHTHTFHIEIHFQKTTEIRNL